MKLYIYIKPGYRCVPGYARACVSEDSSNLAKDEMVYSSYETPFLHMLIEKVRKVTHQEFGEDRAMTIRTTSAQVVDTELFAYLTGDMDKELKRTVPFSYCRVYDAENPYSGYSRIDCTMDRHTPLR